jgi:hypothetical protein
MTDKDGPPKEVGPDDTNARANQRLDTHTAPDTTNYVAGLHRRRQASYRLPVLDSGRSDPWHYDQPAEPSEQDVDGYCAAATLLIGMGLLPAPNVPAMRVMWRRAEQRDLARYIAERWEVAA